MKEHKTFDHMNVNNFEKVYFIIQIEIENVQNLKNILSAC